jgi:hypoxanthine phosphoribosyltransferase
LKTLLTEDELRDGVARLAGEISAHYGDRPLTVVGVLTGSLVLLADVIRRLEMPLRVGLIEAASYRGEATHRGPLAVHVEMLTDIRQRDVLVIDDIFDTGHTLVEVVDRLRALEPASIRSAVLLRKAERRQVDAQPDHVVFDIPNRFVVGYGLDYNDLYRNLPFLAALEDSEVDQ